MASEQRSEDGRFPRVPNRVAGDWIIEPAFIKRVKDELCKVPEHYELDMEHIEEVLLALEKVQP